MNAVSQEMRAAGRNLAATPAAMFLAVLTVGFAIASAAQHMGLYSVRDAAARRSNVVLACPSTNAAKNAQANGAGHPSSAPAGSATLTAANADVPPVKPAAGKSGGSELSVPLPDFRAPELSRFISPL